MHIDSKYPVTEVSIDEANESQFNWGVASALDFKPRTLLIRRYPNMGFAKLECVVADSEAHEFKYKTISMRLVEKFNIHLSPNPWTARMLDVGSESHYVVATADTPDKAVAKLLILTFIGKTFSCPKTLENPYEHS